MEIKAGPNWDDDLSGSPIYAENDLNLRLRESHARLTAALGNARCQLYYLDTGEHCVKLTRDADAASGLVVGLRDADGD